MTPESITAIAALATGVAAISAVIMSAVSLSHQLKRNTLLALAAQKQGWVNELISAVAQLSGLSAVVMARKNLEDDSMKEFLESTMRVSFLLSGEEGCEELLTSGLRLSNRVGYHIGNQSEYFDAIEEIGELVAQIEKSAAAKIKSEKALIKKLTKGKVA